MRQQLQSDAQRYEGLLRHRWFYLVPVLGAGNGLRSSSKELLWNVRKGICMSSWVRSCRGANTIKFTRLTLSGLLFVGSVACSCTFPFAKSNTLPLPPVPSLRPQNKLPPHTKHRAVSRPFQRRCSTLRPRPFVPKWRSGFQGGRWEGGSVRGGRKFSFNDGGGGDSFAPPPVSAERWERWFVEPGNAVVPPTSIADFGERERT